MAMAGLLLLSSAGLTAGSINASAAPVQARLMVGCTGKIVNVAGSGNKSTAQCTNLDRYSEIRAIAQCNSGNLHTVPG